MPVILGGLGQPEEGSPVLGGMGLSEPAPPGAMSAILSGSGALTAELDGVQEQHPFIPGAAFVPPRKKKAVVKVGALRADLSGASAIRANLTRDPLSLTDDEFNAQVIMLLEGVTV